jgi:cellobiose phosphorylase
VAPVFPRSWSSFSVLRRFRGVNYQISVERKGEGNQVSLMVDGQPIPGNLVPLPADSRQLVNVRVTVN